ncbi:MAG: protein-L-isoaspartate(D-aspartate) O-methyltransferase [Acidobacteria bacterium]|nr:protein-L-isoaspartate(D-aspartate) O-methyltransferase [Acidobacteriota bacterium]
MAAPTPPADSTQRPGVQDDFTRERLAMVAEQIAGRGVDDPRVLAAMREVPRHLFVAERDRANAYIDAPLGIDHGQTISQPYIVALMTKLARPRQTDRALEIGTGSGYQAAVLSMLVDRVFSLEIVAALADTARDRLAALGYRNVTVRQGDGYLGWPGEAPFDIILVTAAPDDVPPALVSQLRPGGRLVIPVGRAGAVQDLVVIEKDAAGAITRRSVIPVRFVPLVKKR